nr:protein FAM161B-like [Lytechinus pictus]
MATGHSLSVVTNSCITRPRIPNSNLPESELDRDLARSRDLKKDALLASYNGSEYHEYDQEQFAQSHSKGFGGGSLEEDALIDQLTNDVENISSEDFYKRLKELKEKHRVTLNSLEKRYKKKVSRKRQEIEFENNVRNEMGLGGDDNGNDWSLSMNYMNGIDKVKGMTKSGPVYVAEHEHKHMDDTLQAFNQSLPAWSALPRDNVRDMSSKPPTGRPQTAWTERPKSRSSARNGVHGQKQKPDWSDVTWSGSECSATTDEILSSVNTSLDLSLSKQPGSPAAVVDNMWEDFSVDSYVPRSRSLSRASARSNSTQQSKAKEWSPKITIPKPFSMSLRESSEERKKTRASMDLDQARLDREKQEEIECQKKFKANPVPAHTFLPLYDEIMDQQVEKSKKNREESYKKLTTTQKPFKLTETKKHQRSASAPLSARRPKTPSFKAKPVPNSVFDPTVDEQILEEEEYRKIRIKMRAEEMLRQSSLPPNMQIRGKEYTDGKMRMKMQKKREKQAFLTTEHKFRPQVNGEIPDYDELHRRFQEEVQRKKREKDPTVIEPFNLRTARIPSRKSRALIEMEEEEERRKEALRGSLSKSASLRRSIDMGDTLPSKTTNANELRKSALSKTQIEKAERERQEVEQEKQRRYREKKLQRFITSKARANDTSQSLETTNREKLRQHRESERAREEEYERELQEMMARIESRPLLFERETELNAKKRAERKYESALKNAGISEDFLERKGRSGATQILSGGGGREDESRSEASYNYDYDDDGDDYGGYSGAGDGRDKYDDDDTPGSDDD